MRWLISVYAALLLCSCCVESLDPDEYLSKTADNTEATAETELSLVAEKAELKEKLTSLLQPTSYTALQLGIIIDQVFTDIERKLIKKPGPAPIRPCGHRNVDGLQQPESAHSRNVSKLGEFPWMVDLMVRESNLELRITRHIGGGSLLAPNIVLTAAHKVINQSAELLLARAGEWNQLNEAEELHYQDLPVKSIILHGQFSSETTGYNIALLVLSSNFAPLPHLAPICLPSPSEVFDHARCIVTGWGKATFQGNDYQHVMKLITVPVLPHADCVQKFDRITGRNLDTTTLICAGGEPGVDSCTGDGGGPLICPIKDTPNRYQQVGIVSWGIGCGKSNVPAAYTNVQILFTLDSATIEKITY